MKDLLTPDLKVKSIFDIDLQVLQNKGINSLIIDLDNTITRWNALEVSNEVLSWFERIKEKGFKACLVSNNPGERVSLIAEVLGIPSIPKAGKPRRKAFRQALKILESNINETAVIGDQIFTDVLGGNRMGLYTILVEPISSHEFIGTKIMRFFEKFCR
ncbi:MAG: HAD-superfamily phosphatase subfamily IIIA [Clostridia bacterium 41_269]|nr:MAG: HAD-superfamily phosphatase subfamily IIIA [Clostridia bacterium 41_269]